MAEQKSTPSHPDKGQREIGTVIGDGKPHIEKMERPEAWPPPPPDEKDMGEQKD